MIGTRAKRVGRDSVRIKPGKVQATTSRRRERTVSQQVNQPPGADAQPTGPTGAPNGGRTRSTPDLVRSIVTDTTTLVRKEVELARQEVTAGIKARAVGAGAFGAAAVAAFFAVIFLSLAAAAALALVVPAWAAALIVAGVYLLVAGVAALFGRGKMKGTPITPTETQRTVKENMEWAKTQLQR